MKREYSFYMNRICSHCVAEFEIVDTDLEFYDKISPIFRGEKYNIPSPGLCMECRLQKRNAIVNIRNLYWRKCDMTGRKVLSIYSSKSLATVCENPYWWSDKWDPLSYGRDFDFTRPFFSQFQELFHKVPTMALVVADNKNSEYVNYAGWDKNCYLCFCTDHSEDCLYSQDLLNCKNTLDSVHSYGLELCYECIDCNSCYNLQFSQNCSECSDSSSLYDCRNCTHCFGCVGLQNKKYCLYNQQFPLKEYEQKLSQVFKNMSQKDRQSILLEHPRKSFTGENTENSSGDYLYNCKNSKWCFDCSHMEDSKYCTNMKGGGKNCYDITRWGNSAEFCYECCGVGEGAMNILWSLYSWGGISDLYYCYLCLSCQNCFGSVSLRQKKYCILNKQYSKEEYEELVPKIIGHMRETGEWGEFFPVELSPFCYNETVAQEYYPLTKEEVLEKGWKWKEEERSELEDISKKIAAKKLPPNIEDIPDDILSWAIECEETKKLFKIQKVELEFYRKQHLPIPHYHPDVRHQKRMALRNTRKLYKRACDKCSKSIQTTYSPERPEKIYCEECYLEHVY